MHASYLDPSPINDCRWDRSWHPPGPAGCRAPRSARRATLLPDGAHEFALPPPYSIPLPVTLKDNKDGQPVERILKDTDELWQADHGSFRDTNLGANTIRATAALATAFPRHFVPEQGGKHHAQPS